MRILVGTQVKDKCGFCDFSEDGILNISPKDKDKACKAWLICKKQGSQVNVQSVTDICRTLITNILFTQKSYHQNSMSIITTIHWEKFSQFVNNYLSVQYFPECLFIISNYFCILCPLQKMYHGFILNIIYNTNN